MRPPGQASSRQPAGTIGRSVRPAVPVFGLAYGERPRKLGNVPVGTEVTLDEVYLLGRAHYYALKFTPAGGQETTAWVSGRYIAPSGLAPVK